MKAINILGLTIYWLIAIYAWLGELSTEFAKATLGFYYITLGMPAFAVAWTVWAASTLAGPRQAWACAAVGLLLVTGYFNIG